MAHLHSRSMVTLRSKLLPINSEPTLNEMGEFHLASLPSSESQ